MGCRIAWHLRLAPGALPHAHALCVAAEQAGDAGQAPLCLADMADAADVADRRPVPLAPAGDPPALGCAAVIRLRRRFLAQPGAGARARQHGLRGRPELVRLHAGMCARERLWRTVH